MTDRCRMDRVRTLRIGSTELTNNLILGPMAGVTDLVFRRLCREQGCGAAYTEMVSAKALFYHREALVEFIRGGGGAPSRPGVEDRDGALSRPGYEDRGGALSRSGYEYRGADKSLGLMRAAQGEGPLALQLFGSEPEILAEVAAIAEAGPYAWIDVNMGCPVPKIVNNGEGSALMKDMKQAEAILRALTRRVKKPVTVKFRKSFDETTGDAVEFAKMAEACGVAAVAIHGRTRQQFYSGKADWDVIRRVKDAVKIPVIGNGDIFTPKDAERMLAETGCDGLMIAREARENPWIFRQILHYLETKETLSGPNREEVCALILRHAQLLSEDAGERMAIRKMRGYAAWYTSGMPHSSRFRDQLNRTETLEELKRLLSEDFLGRPADRRE